MPHFYQGTLIEMEWHLGLTGGCHYMGHQDLTSSYFQQISVHFILN